MKRGRRGRRSKKTTNNKKRNKKRRGKGRSAVVSKHGHLGRRED